MAIRITTNHHSALLDFFWVWPVAQSVEGQMVARLVAGDLCAPGRELSDRELMDLYYHRFNQFSRGKRVRALLPTSAPQLQMKTKNSACKAAEPPMGSIQQLMLRHFREIAGASTSNFFSLPKFLFQGLPAQTLAAAITSGLQLNTLEAHSGSVGCALPLQDRVTGQEVLRLQLPPPPSLNLANQQSDGDEFLTIVPGQRRRVFFNPKVTEIRWHGGVEHIFFRVCHATPNRMKRPTKSVDDLRPDDIVIRLYKVLELDPEQKSVFLEHQGSDDVVCASLLSWWDEENGPAFVQNLSEWQVSGRAQVRPRDSKAI